MILLKYECGDKYIELIKDNVVPIQAVTRLRKECFRVLWDGNSRMFDSYKSAYDYFRGLIGDEPIEAPNPFEVC